MRSLTALCAAAALTLSGATSAAANDADDIVTIPATPYTFDAEFSGFGAQPETAHPAALAISVTGRVTGYTGCNRIEGQLRFDGDQVVAEELAMSRRGCHGNAAAIEKAIVEGLTNSTFIHERYDFFILNAGTDEALYFFH